MAVVKRYLAGAAVLALGWFLSAPAVAEAAIVQRDPEKIIVGLPAIPCAPSNLSYVIDGDNIPEMCGGKATMVGHGWVNYLWPEAINRNFKYVSGIAGEDGTEKISVYPTITAPGYYEVWASYRASENRSTATPFFVYADNNTTYKIVVNQKELPGGTRSVKLGTFYFAAHALNETPRTTGIVTCQNEGARTSESIDAVFLKYVKPPAPANVSASDAIKPFVINVRWTPVAEGGAKYYLIYRNTVNNPATAQQIAKVGTKTTLFQDKPVDEGQSYYYWVRTGGWLGKLSGYSKGDRGSTGYSPAKVMNLVAVAGVGEVDLSWGAAANTDSYEVFRGTTDVAAEAALIATVPGLTLTYKDGDVTPGTYYYFVRGKNAIANGEFSDFASALVQ